jgi:hypothetical protein
VRTTDLGFRAPHGAQCFRVYRAILGGYPFVLITAGSGCLFLFQNQRTGESRTVRTGVLGFLTPAQFVGFYRAILGGYLVVLITAGSGCLLIFQNQRTGES